MNIAIPYSFKRKLCVKRKQKRKIDQYKSMVNQIVDSGRAEVNGNIFTSIADLTAAFYKN